MARYFKSAFMGYKEYQAIGVSPAEICVEEHLLFQVRMYQQKLVS